MIEVSFRNAHKLRSYTTIAIGLFLVYLLLPFLMMEALQAAAAKNTFRADSRGKPPRVIIVPGNGCTNVQASSWYSWMQRRLIDSNLFSEVIVESMPDPYEAKRSIWLPFIRSFMKDGDSVNTIIIGHSSGAVAAMRLLEDTPLLGCVLVSACHTDLDAPSERISGYYPGFLDGVECTNEWQWEKIRTNAEWILQFHSTDDPFIPRTEADYVAKQLGSEYVCFEDKSHFFSPVDAEPIFEALKRKVTVSGVSDL